MRPKTVKVERTVSARPEVVWTANTNKDHMEKWYFTLKEFRAEVGFKFSFESPGKEGQIFNHLCEVTEVVPGQKITYSWAYEGYEGISYVSFELVEDGNKTKVILTHTGLDSFPAIRAFAPENFREGWTAVIGTMLRDYVEQN